MLYISMRIIRVQTKLTRKREFSKYILDVFFFQIARISF